jgi:hypothetical protein
LLWNGTMKMKNILLLLIVVASFDRLTQAQQSAGDKSAKITKKVCILGNVTKQREISFDARLTVTKAIEQAGGIRPDSKDNDVILISQMIGPEGGLRIIWVDLKAVEKKLYKDFDLQDRDIIEVLSRKPDKVREPFINPCPWAPVFKNPM